MTEPVPGMRRTDRPHPHTYSDRFVSNVPRGHRDTHFSAEWMDRLTWVHNITSEVRYLRDLYAWHYWIVPAENGGYRVYGPGMMTYSLHLISAVTAARSNQIMRGETMG